MKTSIDLQPWIDSSKLDASLPDVELVQHPRVFGSPIPVREASATVLGMVGHAVNNLWELKTGRRQHVSFDTRHAELSMGSTWLLRLDGTPAHVRFPMGGSPVEGAFETADGRLVYLLCAFPAIIQATIEALGCEATREAVALAVAKRSSVDLESMLNSRGLTGVVIRSIEEWRAHPQGMALREQPVVRFTKLDNSPPVPMPEGLEPLSGIRVIDATRVIAGPMATRTLAEFGADVLQIGAPHLPDLVASEADTGHGKRRCRIDLNGPEGVEQFRSLARQADVLVQAFRGGSFERRGLSAEAMARERPGLVYVTESAYGSLGPWANKRGFDGNIQATSGVHDLHARRGFDALERHGLAMAINDYCTGYWGAYGALEGLRRRATEGGSWHVEVALATTMTWFLRPPLLEDSESGVQRTESERLFEEFSEQVDSEYGRITRLRPVLQLSETPARWKLPTVVPGTHEPVWT
ncbi:MAG: CoA transferase [Dehalococcoidia bacterium]